MSTDIEFITLKDLTQFNWKNIVIEPPKMNKFTKPGTQTEIKWVTSKVYCKGPHGEKLRIIFQLPKESTLGILGCWPMGMLEAEQTLDNIEGLQVLYPMTSLNTIDSPSEDEKKTTFLFDKTRELTANAMKLFCTKDETGIVKLAGNPAQGAYSVARDNGNILDAVKPNYDWAYEKQGDKKIPDKKKPKRAYLKLDTKGTGSKLKCLTKIYGPGDKEVHYTKYMCRPPEYPRGDSELAIEFDSIFWGAHGPESGYGGSCKFKIYEMNFTPESASNANRTRVLSPNTAVDGNESTSDDDKEGSSFQSPLGTGQVITQDYGDEKDAVQEFMTANLKREESKEEPEELPVDDDNEEHKVEIVQRKKPSVKKETPTKKSVKAGK